MMFKKSLITLTVLLLIIISYACSSDDGVTNTDENEFERAEMLANFGNNVILPSYDRLKSKVGNLNTSINEFTANPNESTLAAAQDDLKEARLAWQSANMFQFGPAESNLLRAIFNTFPTDAAKIESNVESGDFNLNTIGNRDAAGFPALGYLLHGVGDNPAEVIAAYTDNLNAENRILYLQENITLIQTSADATYEEWSPEGGNFVANFLSEQNSGVDVGSSLGQLINAFILHYERFIRDGKIGIPAGVRSANVPRPTTTEAFYAGYSSELAVENMNAVSRLFFGNSLNGEQGIGLDDNLIALEAGGLADNIGIELNEAIASLQALNDPLADQIETNNEPVLNAFTEMQDLIVLLKADMASRLGISITFQDNDGD
ncbi:MAG TPA: imelysin family protein [Balneolaceae bacterium]|nr:imelysin family protein [Balneolaceae bacterium]